MSDTPVEEGTPSTPARVSLRQAFGLGGGDPPSIPLAEEQVHGIILGFYRGAVRALLGREPSAEECDTALPLLEKALLGDVPDIHVEAVLIGLLSSPESRYIQHSTSGALSGDAIFDAVVRAAFRALLLRDGGDNAVRVWREHLGEYFTQTPLTDFIVRFLEVTMQSEEYRLVQRVPQLAAIRAEFLPPPGKVGISTHISLGADGFTSAMFKRFALKRWSGPFDWCSTSPAIIRAVLEDDFAQFLAPDGWRSIPVEDRPDARFWQCHHPGYEQRFGHPCILHTHDMTQEWGQLSMLRGVERFRASLRSLSSKLVLQVAPEGADPGGEFLRTTDVLDGIGRNIHFVMVSLLPGNAEGPFPEVEPALARGAHRLLRMKLLSRFENTEARDPMDEVVLLRAALSAPTLGETLPEP